MRWIQTFGCSELIGYVSQYLTFIFSSIAKLDWEPRPDFPPLDPSLNMRACIQGYIVYKQA